MVSQKVTKNTITFKVDHLIGFGAMLKVEANSVKCELRQTVWVNVECSVAVVPSMLHC